MADTPQIPELLLERHALGELSEREARRLEKQLSLQPASQLRLEQIRRSNAEILAAYPPDRLVPRIAQRTRAQTRARTPWLRSWGVLLPAGSAVAAAALVLFVMRPVEPLSGRIADVEVTRIKGLRPTLLVFPKPAAGEQARALPDGATVHARELLQLGYVPAGRAHGVVLSIDGRGATTLHFPATVEQPTRLAAGQVLLPSAYELDDAPRFERFFLITGPSPIDVAAVLASARRLAAEPEQAPAAPLLLPGGLEQSSLLLWKVREGSAP